MRTRRFFGAAAVVALAATGLAGTASATVITPIAPTCGMVITTSVMFTSDLVCPADGPTTAVTIAPTSATAITVDLGGHAVVTERPWGFFLVPDFHGAAHATLRGGTIRTTGGGAADFGGMHATYKNVIFDGGGIATTDDDGSRVSHCTFVHGASVSSTGTTTDIEDSTFIGNGSSRAAIDSVQTFTKAIDNTISGYAVGIRISDSLGSADFEHNHITGNGTGIEIGSPTISSELNFSVIAHNEITSNTGDGLLIHADVTLSVANNKLAFNGHDGIEVDSTTVHALHVTFTANRLLTNADWGIEAPTGNPAVTVIDGGRNLARGNVAGQCQVITCGT